MSEKTESALEQITNKENWEMASSGYGFDSLEWMAPDLSNDMSIVNQAAAELAKLKNDLAQADSELSYEIKQNAELRAALKEAGEVIENIVVSFADDAPHPISSYAQVVLDRGRAFLKAHAHLLEEPK
jgi:hypothetical protein